MDISFFIKGLIIGFSIAAPVGPIGVLCIHRTLTQGCVSGLVSGLGAATADAIYGSIAGLGLTFLSSVLIHQQRWLQLFGGAFLCYLGIKTWVSLPAQQA
ncbi:MAG TPA: LysE family transporter, partial [Coleofasciculaceae cyanobacterium]